MLGPRPTLLGAAPLLALLLSLSLATRPALGADPPPAGSSEPGDPPPSPQVRTAAKVSILVGGVMILGGFLPALLGLSKKAQLDAACPGRQCGYDRANDIETLRAYETQTNVLWIGGAIVAASGIALYLWGPGHDDAPPKASPWVDQPAPPRSSLRLAPAAAPGGGALFATGTF